MMEKLPTKQIYLLAIIIMGIITLSVYSTYAIFTFEKQTEDIVNLNTPTRLAISENIQEYKQMTIPKNSYITTDIDLYNTLEYENCYSIWYKILDLTETEESLVKVYQKKTSTSGVINPISSIRINVVITNDNDKDIKLNIGVSNTKNEGTCSLNISKDKKLIKNDLDDYKKLTEFIKNNPKEEPQEEGYNVYTNYKEPILIADKIYVSSEYTYHNEEFNLKNPILIESKKLEQYESSEEKKYYTCLTKDKCKTLYGIKKTSKELKEDNQTEIYKITEYEVLKGYLRGNSGIKTVTTDNIDNYYYFGDNPKNYLYYNCKDDKDLNTCELWRIIGVFYNQKEKEYVTKIIREDSIGEFQYNENESNIWDNSNISKYLNKDYKINNLEYLYQYPVYQEYLPELAGDIYEIKKSQQTSQDKFTIMSLSDYIFTTPSKELTFDKFTEDTLKYSWLNKNDDKNYYTMTREEQIAKDEKPTEKIEKPKIEETPLEGNKEPEEVKIEEKPVSVINNKVFSVGNNIKEITVDNKLEIRPVVYLKPRILLVAGDGTIENPYVIK